MTNQEIADDMLVNVKTVERILNGETRSTSINNIVAMCLSLQLSPDLCDYVIDLSPVKFSTSEKDYRLKFLMRMVAGKGMKEVREEASKYGIEL